MSRFLAALLCAVLTTGCTTTNGYLMGAPPETAVFGGGDDIPDPPTESRQAFQAQGTTLANAHFTEPSLAEPKVRENQQPTASRLQVYSGSFQVSTIDIESSASRLIAMVKEKNGYLQSRTDALVVCKVPSQHFQTIVDRLEDCGTVVSRSVQTDDVTDEYKDLGLRLGVMESSRQRLVALMDQAGNLEELLKLEEQLTKLTAEIESLKGKLKKLSQDISYSTIQVNFATRSVVGRRKSSPFPWVNRLGAEQVLTGFHINTETSGRCPLRKLVEGQAPMSAPDGFLVVASSRRELQAVSPDDARVWLREFPVDNDTTNDFWARAIQTHLVDHLGYRLIDQTEITGPARQTGHQMLFASDSAQGPMRYLLTVLPQPKRAWSSKQRIQVVEFAATAELYAEYVDAVGEASPVSVAVQERPLPGAVLVSER